MTTSEHIKHLQDLISLSSMTKQEKDIVLNALKDFVYHEIKKGGNNE